MTTYLGGSLDLYPDPLDLVAALTALLSRNSGFDPYQIATDYLQAGMTTIQWVEGKAKKDVTLKELLPGTRGCRGLHFLTTDNRNVCYLLGGRVWVIG